MKATILLDHDALDPTSRTSSWHRVRLLLRVTGEPPERDEGPPLDLSLVLDRSGSMTGEKLDAVRDATVGLLRRLRPTDVMSVVSYDQAVRTVAEPGSIADPEAAAGQSDLVRRVRAMADAGGGNTWYIERPDQAGDVFGEEMEGLLGIAAQNLALEIHPRAAELTVVHHSYPRTEVDGGVRLEIGDLYAREPRDVLVELSVSVPVPEAGGGGEADPIPLGELVLSGAVIEGDGGVVQREIRLPVSVTPGEGPRVELEVRRQLVLLETAKAREEALDARRRGDYEGGSSALRETARRVREVAEAQPEARAEELRREAHDLESMAERFQAGSVDEADRKYLYQAAYDLKRSRRLAREKLWRKMQGEESRKELE